MVDTVRLVLVVVLLISLPLFMGCQKDEAAAAKTEPASEKSSIRQAIEDGVDATITHKSQIEAYQRSKKKLDALNARNQQMIDEMEKGEGF